MLLHSGGSEYQTVVQDTIGRNKATVSQTSESIEIIEVKGQGMGFDKSTIWCVTSEKSSDIENRLIIDVSFDMNNEVFRRYQFTNNPQKR